MALFSLIIPTRERIDGLRRLLDSLREQAQDSASLEVLLVVDEDDRESREFTYPGLLLSRVIVPPGQTMGNLNLAGYGAASGRYLMLLNDDVVVRTRNWDAQLRHALELYPDGITLVHVNDLVFGDSLCTFPVLTREFCELSGGICRPEYRRYRIDDHIHHIFDLISLLGHTRRVYLHQVIFEHRNTVEDAAGKRRYVPDPVIQELDERDFQALAEERRRLALACVERIEGRASSETQAARKRLLEKFPDSVALRRGAAARWFPPLDAFPAANFPARRPLPAKLADLGARLPFSGNMGFGLPAGLFDADWYRARYPDAAAAGGDPLRHYLERGAFQGYDPNPHFHSAWYLAHNPDVAASGMNPLLHFVRYGAREGRNPNLHFHTRWYVSQHPPLRLDRVNPLAHFLTAGIKQDRSPAAGATLAQYLERLMPVPNAASPAPGGQVAISVVIPTRNRAGLLMRTLAACARHAATCELELVVIDDGSTDATPDVLRELSTREPRLRWQTVAPGGPARARNVAANMASHNVLLFMGDDIVPADDNFFSTHSTLHAAHPEAQFAVLGKVEWPGDSFPVSYAMKHMAQEGAQFAFSRLAPGALASWQYFYAANVSVKKSLVEDWENGGFDAGFPAAALEDVELGYRLWQVQPGLSLHYDPASTGLHHHPCTLGAFLDRQHLVGRCLPHMLALHPELLDEYGLRRVEAELRAPAARHAAHPLDGIRRVACELEARNLLGSEDWHGTLLSALFELYMHEGYISQSPATANLAAARRAILDRFFSRLHGVPGPAMESLRRAAGP